MLLALIDLGIVLLTAGVVYGGLLAYARLVLLRDDLWWLYLLSWIAIGITVVALAIRFAARLAKRHAVRKTVQSPRLPWAFRLNAAYEAWLSER